VTRGGSQLTWNANGVKFGPGVAILGAPIGPRTQLPVAGSPVSVKQAIWVDFRLESIGVSALALLEQAMVGVAQIVASIGRYVA
jgi:hypothetical protein